MTYDSTRDPRAQHAIATDAPARKLALITPADGAELAVYARALRVYNPGGGTGALVVVPIGHADGEAVTLKFAAGVTIEPTQVRRVLATGSDATLIVHGYID